VVFEAPLKKVNYDENISKKKTLECCLVVLKPRLLRYKSRLTSLTITSSFFNSGSVFNNKVIKKEFILALKSSLSEGIYESFYV